MCLILKAWNVDIKNTGSILIKTRSKVGYPQWPQLFNYFLTDIITNKNTWMREIKFVKDEKTYQLFWLSIDA